jgi:hypothetical protein
MRLMLVELDGQLDVELLRSFIPVLLEEHDPG